MQTSISIRKASGKWVVRTDNSVLGETQDALEVSEPGHDPVIYFPKNDIGMAFFEQSETTSHCPLKGAATYYHMVGRSKRVEDAAWSYETPTETAARLRGYIAFSTTLLYVEQL